jgi:hypothetical protein
MISHAKRWSATLAGSRLSALTVGASRVALDLLFHTCRRHYPGGSSEYFARTVRMTSAFPEFQTGRLRITLFEACSALTHVTACMFAESPRRPSTPKASVTSLPPSPLRLLPAGATVAGWVSHPLEICAFSRRTEICGLVIPSGCGLNNSLRPSACEYFGFWTLSHTCSLYRTFLCDEI